MYVYVYVCMYIYFYLYMGMRVGTGAVVHARWSESILWKSALSIMWALGIELRPFRISGNFYPLSLSASSLILLLPRYHELLISNEPVSH